MKKPAKAFVAYSGATREYVVKSGDSLGHIAYGNGITIRQLKELNSLKSDRLAVGQKLKIPAAKVVSAPSQKKPAAAPAAAPAPVKTESAAPAPAAPAPAVESAAAAAPAAEPAPAAEASPAAEAGEAPAAEAKSEPAAAEKTYVVQEGDDMTGVSIRWAVSAAAIRELNNLGDNDQLKPGQIIKLPADAAQQ
jgi:LysM repeat protein